MTTGERFTMHVYLVAWVDDDGKPRAWGVAPTRSVAERIADAHKYAYEIEHGKKLSQCVLLARPGQEF